MERCGHASQHAVLVLGEGAPQRVHMSRSCTCMHVLFITPVCMLSCTRYVQGALLTCVADDMLPDLALVHAGPAGADAACMVHEVLIHAQGHQAANTIHRHEVYDDEQSVLCE
jgi:hypothetical protein